MLYITSHLYHTYVKAFPKFWYKVIGYYGIFAVLDPVCVLFADLYYGDYANGDFFKFYTFFVR